ncbi:hypothetical protein Tco_1560878 [Tanacetum coccineum]
MNTSQDIQMLMVDDNIGNRFTQTAGMSVGIQSGQIAVQNVGNMDRISVVTGLQTKDTLQQASTSGTQSDKAPIYDSDGSTENDSNIISMASSVEQGGGTVEQHSATIKETRAYQESLLLNLVAEVEKVNMVNCKMRETNAKLTTELDRYKNQEKCFEISQDKYEKLERCYQQSVYQEQCLTKKINTLHLSSGKQITALNEEISNLNKQLSMEKSIVSSLLEEKKRLKSDFKIHEDELLDKHILLENKIKELDNILKMALGYQNPFYLKQAQQKQQSLYNGKVLLEKHDPPIVHDSEETLQLAQESQAADFVQDFKSLANKADESLDKQKTLEREFDRLLEAVVSQEIMSIVQDNSVVDTSNLQTELARTKESFEKSYNDMQQTIERLQAQLGNLKGKSKDTSCASDTLDPLSQKLENENVELEFQVRNYKKEIAHLKTTFKNLFDSISVTLAQTKTLTDSLQTQLQDSIYENAKLRAQLFDKVSKQKDKIKGTSVNTKFANQSILGRPFLQPIRNNFVVRQPNVFQSERPKFSNNQTPQKVDKTNDLSKPVTSNSIPSAHESKVVNITKVIAPGRLRMNPTMNSRVDKFVPNKHVKASVRTNPITGSQPHVITKNDVTSKTNGFSPKDVKCTTRTRRPQLRNNHMSDKVPFKSKSSCLSNELEKIEENHRSLLSFNYPDHTSSECNNIKLAIQNKKSEVIYATCKQCLITANHDDYVLQYVNGMKSKKKNQSANVLKSANQTKYMAQVWKPKNVGSKEKLASPKPRSPRSCFKWSPTGRMFDLKGKIITTSESVCQSDCSKGDNACTPNPQEPIIKRFPVSIVSMTGCQNWFDTLLIPLLLEYKPKDKEYHGDNKSDI